MGARRFGAQGFGLGPKVLGPRVWGPWVHAGARAAAVRRARVPLRFDRSQVAEHRGQGREELARRAAREGDRDLQD
eukprot:9018553-Pyramimonas_sp.AAC.1